MKILSHSFLCLALCLGIASAGDDSQKNEKEDDGDVIVLTEKNFDKMIMEHDMLMVKFYAPWCGACKQMAPSYKELASDLKKSNSKFKIAKLDATAHMAIGQKYNVISYPTLKFFYKLLPIDYEGPRVNADIVKFMEKKAGKSTKPVSSEKDIEKLAKANELVILGFFKDPESKDAKTFVEAAKLSSYIEFAISSDMSLMKNLGLKESDIIAQNEFPENTGKPMKDKRKKFKGDFTRENIMEWAKAESIPLLVEFNDQTSNKVLHNVEINQHIIVIAKFSGKDALKKAERDKIMIAFARAARRYIGKFLFVYVDANDYKNYPMMKYFGKRPEDTPLFLIFNMKDVAKFHAPEDAKEVTAKNIISLARNYLNGKAEQFFLSGTLTDDWDSKPLKYIVQSNFMNITHNKKTDAIIFYTSNECENCGDKHAIMNKVAEEFKDSEDKVFAFINVSFNEFKDESLTTDIVPALRMFKKGTNEMLEFKARFTIENVKKFFMEYDEQAPKPDTDDDDDSSKHTEL